MNADKLQKFLSIIKDLKKEIIIKESWKIDREDLEFMFYLDENGKPIKIKNPNAFFISNLVNQQIPGEKAVGFPRELYKRLGHLDVGKISKMSVDELYKIISEPQKMHRFPRKISKFLIESCKLLVEKYNGNAENIWKNVNSARELKQKLQEFYGIGDKISNLTIRILVDFFGYDFLDKSYIDLPTDRHVIRILYRLGFIKERDGKEAIIFARKAYPEYPAFLDEPLWYIGKNFCHEDKPECEKCPLRDVCSYYLISKH